VAGPFRWTAHSALRLSWLARIREWLSPEDLSTHRIARRPTCGGGPVKSCWRLAPALRLQLLDPVSIAACGPGHVPTSMRPACQVPEVIRVRASSHGPVELCASTRASRQMLGGSSGWPRTGLGGVGGLAELDAENDERDAPDNGPDADDPDDADQAGAGPDEHEDAE
jgi:hypothetical protein